MVKGLITALITPFLNDKSVDYIALKKLINFQIDNKVDGILLLGTTAEAESLNNKEKRDLVEYCIKIINKRVSIIVGLISNITEDVVNQGMFYKGLDVDAFLVITPYYNKTNKTGLLKHFTYIADRLYKPMIIYNVPSRTGMDIPNDVIEVLSCHNNIIGIKDASGNIIKQQALSRNNKIKYYCGDDKMMYASSLLNASGMISVISNAYPLECVKIFDDQDELEYFKLFDLINEMYSEVSPIGIKYILYKQGLIELNYRRPLDEPSMNLKHKVDNCLNCLNMIKSD